MPRKKAPKLRIIFLDIPIEKLKERITEPPKLKSIEKKYKNLRVAKLNKNFCSLNEIKVKNIEDNDNNEKNQKANDEQKIDFVKQKDVLVNNINDQSIYSEVENDFDLLFSTLTEGQEDDDLNNNSAINFSNCLF